MDEKDLNDKFEQLTSTFDDVNQAYKKYGEDYKKAMLNLIALNKKMGESDEKLIKSSKILITQIDNVAKGFKANAAKILGNIEGLSKALKAGDITADRLTSELETLRKQVNTVTDASQKNMLLARKAALEEVNARNIASSTFKDTMGNISGIAIKGVASAFTGAAKAALSGGDGFAVATSFMTASIDTANGAFQAGSKGIMDLGMATAGAGGKLGKFGIIATVAGSALSFLGNTVSELAKAGITFMLAQTQKTIASFEKLSASGAIFAGGMVEMRNSASDAGLTLEQFSNVVTANSHRFADAGMSMTAAAKELAKVGKIVKDSGIQDKLLNLGYSFEDAADMQAKVMANMHQFGGQASAAQVAEQTQKYAENLKLISDLTGEDAKAKAEKVAAENTELAFEGERAKMSVEQRAQLDVAMAAMTDQERQNLRERMVFGTVINKQGAIMEATVNGAQAKGEQEARLLRENNLTGKTVAETNAQFAEQEKASILANAKDIGLAGMALHGDMADQSKAQSQLLHQTQQFGAEALAKTAAEQKQAETGTGSEDINKARKDSQMLMVETERIATDNLKEFGKAVGQTIDAIKGSVLELSKMSASAASTPPWATALMGMAGGVLQAASLLIPFIKGGGTVGGLGKTAAAIGESVASTAAIGEGATAGAATIAEGAAAGGATIAESAAAGATVLGEGALAAGATMAAPLIAAAGMLTLAFSDHTKKDSYINKVADWWTGGPTPEQKKAMADAAMAKAIPKTEDIKSTAKPDEKDKATILANAKDIGTAGNVNAANALSSKTEEFKPTATNAASALTETKTPVAPAEEAKKSVPPVHELVGTASAKEKSDVIALLKEQIEVLHQLLDQAKTHTSSTDDLKRIADKQLQAIA